MVPNNTALSTFCLPNYDSSIVPPATYTSSVFLSVETALTGVDFTTFASQTCTNLYIDNNTGTVIEVQKNGSGPTITVQSGTGGRNFGGITNADQLAVRRVDQSVVRVIVTAEAITV